MRVCYFGTYRANYSRNQIMIEGLRRNGVEVIECHVPLWKGIEDRVEAASGGWMRLAFIVRVIRAYWRLLRAYVKVSDYDIMMLGYPGQLDVYLARLLTWLRGKPLVLDVFMSIYLIASERGLTDKHPVTARLIYWLEKIACLLPDLLIIDTAEYVQWFQETYGLDPDRFRLVPTGADDRIFHPVETERPDDGLFWVVYYGTFIPNHGVRYIVEAAKILEDDETIRFELIGRGPDHAKAVALAERYSLPNVTFVDWLDKKDLVGRIDNADVCLGGFGTTPQSLMTIQNKIYEGLAMAKPVITGESKAVQRVLQHETHVYLCKRANSQSLAKAISSLRAFPERRKQLAENGHRLFSKEFDLKHNGLRFASHLKEVVSGRTQCTSFSC